MPKDLEPAIKSIANLFAYAADNYAEVSIIASPIQSIQYLLTILRSYDYDCLIIEWRRHLFSLTFPDFS